MRSLCCSTDLLLLACLSPLALLCLLLQLPFCSAVPAPACTADAGQNCLCPEGTECRDGACQVTSPSYCLSHRSLLATSPLQVTWPPSDCADRESIPRHAVLQLPFCPAVEVPKCAAGVDQNCLCPEGKECRDGTCQVTELSTTGHLLLFLSCW